MSLIQPFIVPLLCHEFRHLIYSTSCASGSAYCGVCPPQKKTVQQLCPAAHQVQTARPFVNFGTLVRSHVYVRTWWRHSPCPHNLSMLCQRVARMIFLVCFLIFALARVARTSKAMQGAAILLALLISKRYIFHRFI